MKIINYLSYKQNMKKVIFKLADSLPPDTNENLQQVPRLASILCENYGGQRVIDKGKQPQKVAIKL